MNEVMEDVTINTDVTQYTEPAEKSNKIKA